jgi:hypothetical protein
VQLADADLVDDEDTEQAARAIQPTSVDVDVDCFCCPEPAPESRPRRNRALLASITGLILVAATGLLVAAPPALKALARLNDSAGAARAPAMLTVDALAAPAARIAVQQSPAPKTNNPSRPSAASSPVSNSGTRPKLSAHAKRGNASSVSQKKSTKPARALGAT